MSSLEEAYQPCDEVIRLANLRRQPGFFCEIDYRHGFPLLKRTRQCLHDLKARRSENQNENRRQNEKHEWKNQFDHSFPCGFLGGLASLIANSFSIHPYRPRDTAADL